MIREAIQRIVEGRSLSLEEAASVMGEIMDEVATHAQIASFITALRMKGETAEEISGLAKVMRERCVKIHPKVDGALTDICGTGADRVKTFNISTTAAFAIAAAGVPVAKHGNRAVSSACGSADLLERLGVNLNVSAELVEDSIESIGIGFLFAPNFHPAMKHAHGPRREIGIRTVFNLLGPLTNPADVRAQVVGVNDQMLVEKMASALRNLGRKDAFVVHGLDGIDEVSTIGPTKVAWLHDGQMEALTFSPEDFGVSKARVEDLRGQDIDRNAAITVQILKGSNRDEAKRDAIIANASVGLMAAGVARSASAAAEMAREALSSGKACDKLVALVSSTGGDPSKLEELTRVHE